uniref:Down syndrome cell adhesion molecule n=1 Tax=Strigamia maritima TaxID=126957 RepID=T1JD50_STRMM
EPPNNVDFSNTTGVTIECLATGDPLPHITWESSTGTSIGSLDGVREVLPNGDLVFPPFKAEEFRQDAHAAVYRCAATNAAGTVLSRDVHVRAVVPQPYDIQVYDVYAIVKTTAVLKCHVPSFLEEHVRVTMWLRDEVLIIEPTSIMDGKYAVLPSGELHVRDVEMEDSGSSYRCHVKHSLTGETHFSSASGRLYVREPQGSVPPKITDIMTAVHVTEGETVILPCVAQGHSAPKAEWFAKLNKRQLFPLHIGERVQQTSGALIIHRAQTSDSGTYVCDVSNEAGNDRGETTLTVTASLTVSILPEKQVVDIGKSATFRCVVTGFPVVYVSWYKDGRKLQSDAEKTLSDDTITIASVHVTDKGMYQCLVSNNQESAQGAGQLILGDAAPELVGVFDDNTLESGTDVSLACVATGSPAPVITWFVDDVSLQTSERIRVVGRADTDGSIVSVLNVTETRWEDGGTYRCLANNKAGTVEHIARLNIYGRPAIRPLDKVTAVAGEDVRLNCFYYGYPVTSINWEKDGRALPFNLRQIAFPNGTVVIRKVQRATDSGKYTCTVVNDKGQSAQEHVEMAVMVPPKIVPFTFQDEHLLDGMLVRVSCVVSRGDLPLVIRWEKDGLPIVPDVGGMSVRAFDEYSSVLSIDPLSRAHSGNYTCIASNHAATATFTVPLVVYVPPRWTLEPRDSSMLLGHSLQLDCQANGFPEPKVTWMKTQGATVGEFVEPVEMSPDLSILSNGSLLFIRAREYHAGHYFCKASNGIGDGLSTAVHVTVQVPPRFDVKFVNQSLKRGEGFRLECPPNGDKPMSFMWKKDGVLLDPLADTRYKIESPADRGVSDLTVEEATRIDTGIYNCKAENEFGTDDTNLQITVFEPPDAPGDIRIQNIGSRNVHVTWSHPFNGHTRIIKYVVEYNQGPEEWEDGLVELAVSGWDTNVTLHGLRPATHYQLRMFAENELGLSSPGDFVTFLTKEEAPAGAPVDVEADAVDANTVVVRWRPPERHVWHGKLRGYTITYYKKLDSTDAPNFRTVQVEDGSEGNHSAFITDLEKFTKYSLTISAFNDQGQGPKSEEILVMTSEDVPSEPPTDVQCLAYTSQSIYITWQAPLSTSFNGILRGYKVFFAKADDTTAEDGSLEFKSTTVVRTTLHGLEKYTNYSLRVAAFTKVGDGAASDFVYCRTMDDVPDVPADVKAIPASKESVLVAWKPPLHSNGVVTKYYVYAKHENDPEEDAMKHTAPPSALYHEISGLKTDQSYEFWVTAATMIGESSRSKMVSEAPQGPMVPARIAAFDSVVTTLWKKYIKLPCKAVGNPATERMWTLTPVQSTRAHTVKESDRLRILPDGNLMVKNVQWNDSGNYTCQVKNGFGYDQIVYVVNILAPPSAPIINVLETTPTSIVLEWKLDTDGGTNVQGYTLNYKRESGHWEQRDLAPDSDSYTLSGLKCGSHYQMYMTAFNKINTGVASEVIVAATNGTVADVPAKEDLIDEDVDYVTLDLHVWHSDSCPVSTFKVEYKQKNSLNWHLLTDELKAEQEKYVIRNLTPGTAYLLRVTALNGAGPSVATYDFITLSRQGVHEDPRGILFYLDLRIIIPLAALVIVVILVLSVTCICANRRGNAARKMKGMDSQNGPHRPCLRTDSTLSSFAYLQRHRSSCDGSILRSDTQEKSIPYSTYNLPNLRSSAEFKTFGQRNSVSDPPPLPPPQNDFDEADAQALQHFSRPPVTNLQSFPSPNGKMQRTGYPVAIPTAPTPPPQIDANSADQTGSPGLKKVPEVPPKPNMVTMETRFSSSPDKVRVRVLPGAPNNGTSDGFGSLDKSTLRSPYITNIDTTPATIPPRYDWRQ